MTLVPYESNMAYLMNEFSIIDVIRKRIEPSYAGNSPKPKGESSGKVLEDMTQEEFAMHVDSLRRRVVERKTLSNAQGIHFPIDEFVKKHRMEEPERQALLIMLYGTVLGESEVLTPYDILHTLSLGDRAGFVQYHAVLESLVARGSIISPVVRTQDKMNGQAFYLFPLTTKHLLGQWPKAPPQEDKPESGDDDEAEDSPEFTAKEIYGILDTHVVGQAHAKKAVSVGVACHLRRVRLDHGNARMFRPKSNILLIGPTGCGKTLMARGMAQDLNLPIAISSATGITETGYVGRDIESILWRLYLAAGKDLERAQAGIVFLDEIDKTARSFEGQSINRDISGEGVQRALLTMMEADSITVHSGERLFPRKSINMYTGGILFIFGGAFEGIGRVVASRTSSRIGFMAGEGRCEKPRTVKPTVEDLINYGMIPEFMGRIPIIAHLDPLGRDELREILVRKNGLLSEYSELMGDGELKLEMSPEAIEAIVERAMEMNAGARGLRSVMEDTMRETLFELGNNTGEVIHIEPEDVVCAI